MKPWMTYVVHVYKSTNDVEHICSQHQTNNLKQWGMCNIHPYTSNMEKWLVTWHTQLHNMTKLHG